jgi:hypothetical protein
MRCGDCQKFVGLDSGSEPTGDLSIEGAEVSGTIEIVNSCAECGTDLQTASFDVDFDSPVEHIDGCSEELELEYDLERWDEFRPPGKKRQVHYYGIMATGKVFCPACKASAEFSHRYEVRASQMDEA